MLCHDYNTPIVSYKSYKGRTIEKNKERFRKVLNAVLDSSLKPEDKKKVLEEMKKQIDLTTIR